MKKIQVFDMETGEVVKEIDVSQKNERMIDKVENGLLNRIDLEKYSTRVVPL